MPQAAANAFRLMRTTDGVIAEFGTAQAAEGAQAPTRIVVDHRVSFSLDTARRLLVWLEDALAPHAASLRSEQAKQLSPEAAARAIDPARGLIADGLRPSSAGDVTRLLSLVDALGGRPYCEQSFRMTDQALQLNRFLLSLDVAEIAGDALSKILALCDALSMPARLREWVIMAFPAARSLHVGHEDHADGPVYKIYLEHGLAPAQIVAARQRGAALVLHEACKWNPVTGLHVTGIYRLIPGLTASQITARLDGVLAAANGGMAIGGAAEAVRTVLALAASRVGAEHLQYLTVEEDGTARNSFDLNLYPARLRVADIQSALWRMAEHLRVPRGRWQVLYDEIKDRPLGHLAGGVHRDGRPFYNVYYGGMTSAPGAPMTRSL